jgi:hypothetical protein
MLACMICHGAGLVQGTGDSGCCANPGRHDREWPHLQQIGGYLFQAGGLLIRIPACRRL